MDKNSLIKKIRAWNLCLISTISIYYIFRLIIIRFYPSYTGDSSMDGIVMLLAMALITIHSIVKPGAIWPNAEKEKTKLLKVMISCVFLKLCLSFVSLDPANPEKIRSFMAKDIYLTVMLTLSLLQIFITSFGFYRLFRTD